MATSSQLPLVSIIILNYNGIKWMKNCLDSVFRSTYPNYEVIIVDNGSKDGSLDVIRSYPKVILIENQDNKGFAEGCNIGNTKASGKYIVLLNNDTTVKEDWINEIVNVMESDPSIGAAQCKLVIMNTNDLLDDTGTYLDHNGYFVHPGYLRRDEGQFDSVFPIFSAKGAALVARSDVVKKVGLLDKDFFSYVEESDFCWRVWLNGHKVVFIPKSVVYHAMGGSHRSREAQKQILYRGTRNRVTMLIKNLQTRNLVGFMLRNITLNLMMACYLVSKGKSDEAGIVIKASFWHLFHLGEILKKRSHVQKSIRRVSDSAVFQYIIKRQSLVEFYRFHQYHKKMLAELGIEFVLS